MAIFDRFKKKRNTSHAARPSTALVPKKKNEPERVLGKSGEKKIITGVLLRMHITEKTSQAQKSNTYTFAVANHANKLDIARAIEGKYGVTVQDVRTLQTNQKERRRGKVSGWKPGFKKAMITIKEGQKIEIQ